MFFPQAWQPCTVGRRQPSENPHSVKLLPVMTARQANAKDSSITKHFCLQAMELSASATQK